MIEVINLTIDAQPPLPDGTAVVHPFYKTSFLKLSGLAEGDVDLPDAYPRANADFLVPILRTAGAGYEGSITRFYDVRTTEEYGMAAPEYALLAGAGLRRVSPLSVKGKGALPFALELSEDQLARGETVLFCCAELYTPLDGQREKRREACAFLLRRCGPEDASEGRTLILEHRCSASKDEVLAAVEREDAALICGDGGDVMAWAGGRYVETPGVVQPFAELLRLRENAHMWIVSHNGGRYGYLHILKGGKAS